MGNDTPINWLTGLFLTAVNEAKASGEGDYEATETGIRRVVLAITETSSHRNPHCGLTDPTTTILSSQIDLLFNMILDSKGFWKRQLGKPASARLFAAVAELKEVILSHDHRRLLT